MKSPMVSKMFPSDVHNYTDLKVMKSAAGYYVGSEYIGGGFSEPGSRDSGYYKSKADAKEFLRQLENGQAIPRMNP